MRARSGAGRLAAPVDLIDHVERAADQRASTISHHIHRLHHVSNACCDGGGRDGCNGDPLATLWSVRESLDDRRVRGAAGLMINRSTPSRKPPVDGSRIQVRS